MLLKGIIKEDFTNFSKPSMFVATAFCDGKCWREQGLPPSTCQNEPIYKQSNIDVSVNRLIDMYSSNPITAAVVFGGLEPLLQIEDLLAFLKVFRETSHIGDTVVIYTGYTENEFMCNDAWKKLMAYDNILMKFGRFRPNETHHIDPLLGVELASSNQYAKYIS